MGRRAKNKQAAPDPLHDLSPKKRKATDEKDARPSKKLKDAAKPKASKTKHAAEKPKRPDEASSDADGWDDIEDQDQCVNHHIPRFLSLTFS